MMMPNGVGKLLDRRAVLSHMGISSSTLDRLIARGELHVAKRVDRGRGKLSPMFDPRAVQALAESRQQPAEEEALRLNSSEASPPKPTPLTPSPTPALALAVKTLHTSQVVILDALQQPSSFAIEAELWHSLLSLVRSQERLMSEVLLGTPLPLEQTEEIQP